MKTYIPLKFTRLPDLSKESNKSLIGLYSQALAQAILFENKRWQKREHVLYEEIISRMKEKK